MARLREGIAAIDGLRLMGQPVFCMVAFTCHGVDTFQLADEMKRRGWFVQAQHRFGELPENIHLSVHPGNLGGIEDFLSDLREGVAAARALPPVALPEGLAQSLAGLDPAALDPAHLVGLLSMAGVSGAKLPEDMAEINHLLNVLPPALKERLLAAFLGQLFSPARGA
jgi:sphinganine-1-phosphate aldolase